MAGPPLKKSSGQKSAGQKPSKLNHLTAKLGELQEQLKLMEAHSEQNEYNIQEAMGLGNDKQLYNAICKNYVAAGQIQYIVQLVLMLAQDQFPLLKRFVNTWPLYDIISRFLRNHSRYMQTKLSGLDVTQGGSVDSEVNKGDAPSDLLGEEQDEMDVEEGGHDEEQNEMDVKEGNEMDVKDATVTPSVVQAHHA
ncbi:hypothetical protein OG21DRAFT_1525676 [Imleria badia]|nr:hypothetical protein OG21DRAFT_1525676 [Imleria badia]